MAHVPLYRELYGDAGFDPDSLRTWDDLQAMPRLGKDLVRTTAVNRRVAAGIRPADALRESTSGSTGQPLEIWTDTSKALIQSLKCVRFLRAWGYGPLHRTVQVWRDVQEPKSTRIQRAGLLRRDYVSIMGDVDDKIAAITRGPVDVLFASRSSLQTSPRS